MNSHLEVCRVLSIKLLLANALFASTSYAEGSFKTLDLLKGITGKYTLSGIHNKHQKDPTEYTRQLEAISAQTPALWSADFLRFHWEADERARMVAEAIEQWESGAVINLMWHACNPKAGELCTYMGLPDNDQKPGPWSYLSDAEWRELTTEGTELHKKWMTQVDAIAEHLQVLQEAKVEVLFRPFHEMNQAAFWWGGRPGPDGTVKLYRMLHDYLTQVKKLRNLIWVWNVQDFPTLPSDVVLYNPGAEYWDVVTLDFYDGFGSSQDLDSGYTQLKYDTMVRVAGNKPMAIGECGRLPSGELLKRQPRWSFFMSWSDETFRASSNSDKRIKDVYADERVLTLNELLMLREQAIVQPQPAPPTIEMVPLSGFLQPL